MTVYSDVETAGNPPLQVRSVDALRPLAWVRLGWRDLDHLGGTSLAYGLLVTLLGLVVLLLASTHAYLIAAAISGFLLIGPIMATGLCELSRRRTRGEPADFERSLNALDRNTPALLRFAGLLLGVTVLWFLVSGLALEAVFQGAMPGIGTAHWGSFLDWASPLQLALYMAVGGILAVGVFILSVVSVPALIDHRISASQAMRTSARTVAANPASMLVWLVLIVALVALGFATFLLGMILIYPLLGHATWHAYQDMVI